MSFDQAAEAVTSVAQSHRAAILVIYKPDVPDATEPATCLRDGDYVYLKLAHPDAWLGPDRAGRLHAGAQSAPLGGTGGTAGTTDEASLQEKEVCHNDAQGLLYCAWILSCSE